MKEVVFFQKNHRIRKRTEFSRYNPNDQKQTGKIKDNMQIDDKWRLNRKKNDFARSCPGLLNSLAEAKGKTVEKVIPLTKQGDSVILFEGGFFLIGSFGPVMPPEILEGLNLLREFIEPVYPDFYRELDRMSAEDRELSRLAKLENILGAIRNNAKNLPELKDALRKALLDLESGTVDPQCQTSPPKPSEFSGDPGKQKK